MAIIDDKTEIVPGSNGSVDNMRIGRAQDGKTIVHFVHYVKRSGDHIDQASIVGEVAFGEEDFKNFYKLLTDHINKHFKS